MKAVVTSFLTVLVGMLSSGFVNMDNGYVEASLAVNIGQNATGDSSSSDNQSANLVLLSHKLKKGDGNYNHVIGEVKNIGNNTIESVEIGLNVYDKNGGIVGTDSTSAEARTLEPNQKSSFDIFSSKDNFEGMDSYELSLSWKTSDGIDEYVDNAPIYKGNTTDAND